MNTSDFKLKQSALPKELSFLLFVLAVVFILWPAKVDAATFNVVAGSSQVNSDSTCQLEEAIGNINDGARTYTDCVETGSYGTNDIINLPAGTITGDGSGITINESVKIVGQGRGSSVLSNKNLSLYGGSSLTSDFTLQDFKMTNGQGIDTQEVEHLTIRGLELESSDDYWSGIELLDSGEANILDSYIHGHLNMSGSGLTEGILVRMLNRDSSEINIERTTIDQVTHGITFKYEGSSAPILNASVKNTTITGIGSSTPYDLNGSGVSESVAAGIWIDTGTNDSQAVFNYSTINTTFSSSIPDNNASAILEISNNGDTINHTAQNDLYAVGDGNGSANYRLYDYGGSSVVNTTSNGGNVSSDASYSSKLTHSKDKNNVPSLASFLGVLKDNGGPVPTLALLDGSPAINAGTNVLGLTTDARGQARVQGSATDAGAYESPAASTAAAVVPGTPNTGFGIFKNNPVMVLLTSFVSAAIIYMISRKQKMFKK